MKNFTFETSNNNFNKAKNSNVVEFKQRLFEKKLKDDNQGFNSPELMKQYLATMQGVFTSSRVVVIALGKRNTLIGAKIVDESSTTFEDITRYAKDSNAMYVCLAHSDRLLQTKVYDYSLIINHTLNHCLEAIDVGLLDHFIVGEKGITSFVEQGYM